MRFFDTNILVYAATFQDLRKKAIAVELLQHAMKVNHDGVISTQVLQEMNCTLLRKFKFPVEAIDEVMTCYVELLASDVTVDVVRRALTIQEEYQLQYYDALIVATASKLGCTEIVSEDLDDSREYCGMAVVNPFRGEGEGERR